MVKRVYTKLPADHDGAQDVHVKHETPDPASPQPTAPAADVVAGLQGLLSDSAKDKQASEAAQASATAKVESAEVKSQKEDIKDALKIATPFAEKGMWWLKPQEFDALWGSEKFRESVAGPAAEIMHRNGWTTKGVMSKYGPYLALAAALAEPVAGTVILYKERKNGPPASTGGSGDGSGA